MMRTLPRALTALLTMALIAATSAFGQANSAVPTDNVMLELNWRPSVSQMHRSCARAIADARTRIRVILRQPHPTFANAIDAYENTIAQLSERVIADQILGSVSPDARIRDSARDCSLLVQGFLADATANPTLYEQLTRATHTGTAADRAQQRLAALWRETLYRAGAGLSPAKRARFVLLSNRLNRLETQFDTNLANDRSTIAITHKQAQSLPPDVLATLKTTTHAYIVPVNESTIDAFLANERDRGARQAFYMAYNRRGGRANIAILESALKTRQQLATIYGAPDWATYTLENKMAANPRRVQAFLDHLDRLIMPQARHELATLDATTGITVQPWDTRFAQARLRQARYAVDDEALRRYFPVPHVVATVLRIYGHLLGVRFEPVTSPRLYAPDVTEYYVHDARTDALIGAFYLDLYPRDGKFTHFADFPLVERRVLPDGRIRAPETIIIGNWPKPAPGAPALLSHHDVQVFFHEFGHNMATLLAEQPYATLNTGFRDDFIEAPSQMLENWVWDPTVLKLLSRNVDSGQPLPDAMIRRIVAGRNLGAGLSTAQQIFYAAVDMRYHSEPVPTDTTAIWAADERKYTPFTMIPGTYPQANFSHIMDGYDAGYYGYLWSKVYAQDMFTAFSDGHVNDPAVGMRYRKDILAPAQLDEPDRLVTRFLGRPMNDRAYYASLEHPGYLPRRPKSRKAPALQLLLRARETPIK